MACFIGPPVRSLAESKFGNEDEQKLAIQESRSDPLGVYNSLAQNPKWQYERYLEYYKGSKNKHMGLVWFRF